MTKFDIMTIVGNRPQFIKMAPISYEFSSRGYKEFIIHSGQHYNFQMSDIFFTELEIPKPNLQLVSQEKLHGKMTADLISQFENVFCEQNPKSILIYGDTNTTLAAALAAVKLKIPIAHVEAGPRIYDIDTPEEINRIVADHAARLRFCPDINSVQNLAKENITEGVFFTGDVMLDAYEIFSKKAQKNKDFIKNLDLKEQEYCFMTVHRPNNTDTKEAILKLIKMIENLAYKVLFAVHPRTEKSFKQYHLWDYLNKIPNIKVVGSLGYLDTLSAISNCKFIITDSGGLQKEAFFGSKPCFILFYTTPWPQIEKSGWQKVLSCVTEIDHFKLNQQIEEFILPKKTPSFFGDGNAAKNIVDILESEGWLGV